VIADVLHFSFTVSDLDRSVEWYTNVLGLELVHRQDQDNDYTRQLVGVPGAVLRVAQLKVPGADPKYSTHMLELVEYTKGADETEVDLPINRTGMAHLAFIVNDLEERYERMVAAGVTFKNPPVRVTAGANTGALACYLLDPDGCTLELMQFPDERADRLGIPRHEKAGA